MVSLASTVVRLFLGQQRHSTPWSRRNWSVQAILLIHSRQQANLLDRDHVRRRAQRNSSYARCSIVCGVDNFLSLICISSFNSNQVRLGQSEIDHDFASTFVADFIR